MSRARVPLHIALPSFSRYTCACMRITLGARCKAVYVRSGKSFASPILMAEPFSARESIENERFAMCHCATTTTTISSNKTYRYVVAVHMGTRAQWFLSAAAAAGKANGFALSHWGKWLVLDPEYININKLFLESRGLLSENLMCVSWSCG